MFGSCEGTKCQNPEMSSLVAKLEAAEDTHIQHVMQRREVEAAGKISGHSVLAGHGSKRGPLGVRTVLNVGEQSKSNLQQCQTLVQLPNPIPVTSGVTTAPTKEL